MFSWCVKCLVKILVQFEFFVWFEIFAAQLTLFRSCRASQFTYSLFLGRLILLVVNQCLRTYFASNWQLPTLNQQTEENDHTDDQFPWKLLGWTGIQTCGLWVLSDTLLTGLWLIMLSINPSLAKHDMPCHSKQCRSRSVSFWRSQLIWICTVCH